MHIEVQASVVSVSSVLRNNLNLCATIAPVFRIIIVGQNFDFLNGVLIRGDDGRAAPSYARGTDAINLVVVFASACSIGSDLATIFDLEDAVNTAGSTNRRARQILCTAARALRSVAKGAGGKL